MQDVIDELAGQVYRYTIIDLSPSFGTFERESITAANEVITPIMPDPFGIDGLQIFAENVTDARQKMHTQKPAYSKIVVTALDNRIKQHGTILAGLKANTSGQSIYAVPVDQVFRRAQTARKTIQAIGDAKPETLAEIAPLTDAIAEVNNG